MERKGFTLIELLVVIVIIGILVAIALPNFIKIKDKAKEAEVKQNLHAIQLAIERYATDMEGNYPYFLYGGDALFNIGTINYYDPHSRSGAFFWQERIALPFDLFWLATDTWDYTDVDDWEDLVQGNVNSAFGDTVAFEGYMPKYPTNPFQVNKKAITFGLPGLDITSSNGRYGEWSCYGGREGNKMWNIGCWGEVPQIIEFPDTVEEVDQDLGGNFYYHPRFGDGITNFEHNAYQMNWLHANGDTDSWLPYTPYNGALPFAPIDIWVDDIHSLDVSGYDLVAIGAPRTKGLDLDNSVEAATWGSQHYFRTGYLTLAQEANPYVGDDAPDPRNGGFDDNTTKNYDERPYSDSVPDFYIIHLGSGLDKKVGNPDTAY